MNLIKISNNILVNADHICVIEQKLVRKEMKVTVCMVNGDEYELDTPIEDMMKEIYASNVDRKQFFAG